MGHVTMFTNTTGADNSAFGGQAMYSTTTGANNTAMGSTALYANTTGASNVAVGVQSLRLSTTASNNVAVGFQSGRALTTGAGNVFLGHEVGQNNVEVTTGADNIAIGFHARLNAADGANQMVMGKQVTCQGNNEFTFGNGATDSNIAFGATSISAPSDERYKEEITTSTAGLSFIKDLRPVTFKWKKAKDVPVGHDAYIADGEEGCNDRVMLSNGETNHGFIAQEVKAAIDNHSELKDGFGMWVVDQRDTTNGRQRVADGALVPMLVKALQELSTSLDTALARIATLEG